MASTRHSPWERATRGQAAAMAAALATEQMQRNQLAEFGGRVRHWEREKVVVCGQVGYGRDGSEHRVGGFQVSKWVATDAPLTADKCGPPKGIEPVRVPFKRTRSPSPDPDGSRGAKGGKKLPPRRSSRLSMTQTEMSSEQFMISEEQEPTPEEAKEEFTEAPQEATEAKPDPKEAKEEAEPTPPAPAPEPESTNQPDAAPQPTPEVPAATAAPSSERDADPTPAPAPEPAPAPAPEPVPPTPTGALEPVPLAIIGWAVPSVSCGGSTISSSSSMDSSACALLPVVDSSSRSTASSTATSTASSLWSSSLSEEPSLGKTTGDAGGSIGSLPLCSDTRPSRACRRRAATMTRRKRACSVPLALVNSSSCGDSTTTMPSAAGEFPLWAAASAPAEGDTLAEEAVAAPDDCCVAVSCTSLAEASRTKLLSDAGAQLG